MKFINCCELSLGRSYTCIYHLVNVDNICSIDLSTDYPIITLVNGAEFIVLYHSDLVFLVGEEVAKDFEDKR